MLSRLIRKIGHVNVKVIEYIKKRDIASRGELLVQVMHVKRLHREWKQIITCLTLKNMSRHLLIMCTLYLAQVC